MVRFEFVEDEKPPVKPKPKTVKREKPKTIKPETIDPDLDLEKIVDLTLNPSARLNLIKFLYPLLTNKSTTNKSKKAMKKAVIDRLKQF